MSGSVVQTIYGGILTGALSFGGWVIMFPLRTVIKRAKKEWEDKSELLQEVHTEMKLQRTNCLTTLQDQGEQQIELLKRAVDTLGEIHLSQAEMAGYMKGRQR